ncbi:DUF5988 family protein [Actinoplanes sp. NPDC049802]|uniref:DUF5988 family protein n=1 Tax=Actinoplanes sp. NPDC049802 TaxID=3154742 RepID=UPI0033CF4018
MVHLRGGELVDVVLEGGPDNLPTELRTVKVDPADEKVKVPHHGGYEHFERAADADSGNGGPVAFRWTMRTRIAE